MLAIIEYNHYFLSRLNIHSCLRVCVAWLISGERPALPRTGPEPRFAFRFVLRLRLAHRPFFIGDVRRRFSPFAFSILAVCVGFFSCDFLSDYTYILLDFPHNVKLFSHEFRPI